MSATKITHKYLLKFFKAIEARSVDQEKASHVNSLTLCFRDSDKERQYQEDPDIGNNDHSVILRVLSEIILINLTISPLGFPASLACSLILTLLLGGLQVRPHFLVPRIINIYTY